MKQVYLDANVLLAQWVEQDPYHEPARVIIHSIENGRIGAMISGLSLAEIASVVSRETLKFGDDFFNQPEGRTELVRECLQRIAQIKNLNIIDVPFTASVVISMKKMELHTVNLRAVEMARITGLTTRDNLHLAVADLATRLIPKQIDSFVTTENGIINRKAEIEKFCSFVVWSPRELVNAVSLVIE